MFSTTVGSRNRIIHPASASAFPNACLCDRGSWYDVLHVHTIEFDQTHFDVVGFCQIAGSWHHAFQPRLIGSD
jgi:hypothetical protein